MKTGKVVETKPKGGDEETDEEPEETQVKEEKGGRALKDEAKDGKEPRGEDKSKKKKRGDEWKAQLDRLSSLVKKGKKR